ncbi:MAG: hypothetical protein HPY76_07745 [Anaerolineae bacterium]|jgi:hypothetical protein|nr:hypothetical protein [Anaerolineae bacterium]
MSDQMISSISKQVVKRFPQMQGVRPKVSAYGTSGNLLIYSVSESTASGKKINMTVRVVVDERGKIKKITTSR